MSELPDNERPDRGLSTQRSSEEQVGLLQNLYNQGILTWRLIWDGRVSFLPKLLLLGFASVYFLSPVDVLPMALFGPLGAVDDVTVMLMALAAFNQLAPPDIAIEHLRELGMPIPNRWRKDNDWDDEDVVDSTADVLDD